MPSLHRTMLAASPRRRAGRALAGEAVARQASRWSTAPGRPRAAGCPPDPRREARCAATILEERRLAGVRRVVPSPFASAPLATRRSSCGAQCSLRGRRARFVRGVAGAVDSAWPGPRRRPRRQRSQPRSASARVRSPTPRGARVGRRVGRFALDAPRTRPRRAPPRPPPEDGGEPRVGDRPSRRTVLLAQCHGK